MNRYLITALFKLVVESDFKTVKIKFLGKGAKEEEVKKYLEDFKKLRDSNRIKKVNEKNIDYWGKQPFKDFTKFIDSLKSKKSKTKEKKKIKQEGTKLVAENDMWLIYEILNHKASCYYGSGTEWCITEKDSKSEFETYQTFNNIYFIINKTHKDKIAMLVDPQGTMVYFDSHDEVMFPSEQYGFPRFTPENAKVTPEAKQLANFEFKFDSVVESYIKAFIDYHNGPKDSIDLGKVDKKELKQIKKEVLPYYELIEAYRFWLSGSKTSEMYSLVGEYFISRQNNESTIEDSFFALAFLDAFEQLVKKVGKDKTTTLEKTLADTDWEPPKL